MVMRKKAPRVQHEAVAVKAGPSPAIPAVTVLRIKALQEERGALAQNLKEIEATLKAEELPVIAALEAGVPLGPGCPPCAVDVTERRILRWKELACGLAAKFLGKAPEVYEAEAHAQAVPRVYKQLIINGKTRGGA